MDNFAPLVSGKCQVAQQPLLNMQLFQNYLSAYMCRALF